MNGKPDTVLSIKTPIVLRDIKVGIEKNRRTYGRNGYIKSGLFKLHLQQCISEPIFM